MGSLTFHKTKEGNNCSFIVGSQEINNNSYVNASNVRRKGQTIFFKNPVYIVGRMSVVGKREGEGPIGKYFDKVEKDVKLGKKNFELAEISMLTNAVEDAVANARLKMRDIDLLISGDLLNQLTTSNYVARDLKVPYIGVYSACSTMTECLALGATLIDAGHYDNIACATSSHFATSERQFRYPLEYGCQRPSYAQWTVTGAGCSILSSDGNGPKITSAVLGKVEDFGINDMNNMGAAMAPSAMSTLKTLFDETNTKPEDYDLIVTGDLGKLGSDILRDLMREKGYELGQRYIDCGGIIFDNTQRCYQGGSGAGCSASVFNSFVLDKMESGECKKVAYLATGALMSPQSCYQGETIPAICHAVIIEN